MQKIGRHRFSAILSCVVIFLLSFSEIVYADDKDDAVTASAAFVKSLTDGDLSSTYNGTSPRFKAGMSEKNFLESMGVLQIQLGGPLDSWTLKGAQHVSKLPATGEEGDFYFVRIAASYAATNVYYDITLEKVADQWRVFWFIQLPAPATK